jgi:GNAT superfamily N-acetyltransferase
MGAGVVAACHPSRLPWLRQLLGNQSRDAIFAPLVVAQLTAVTAGDRQELRGPALKLVCAARTFRPPADPPGVAISVVEGRAVADLYRQAGFGNALAYRANAERPDVAAAVARRGETIVGVAGASADCDAIWQIGVDVIPAARGEGVGRALVGRMTACAFAAGRIPYYSVAASNVHSHALATGLGYWPAWTELHAKDMPTAAGR